MFRIALCFLLLAGTVTNALADDNVSTTISDSKQPLPKSFVIELTRLVMKDATSNSGAGLSGTRLDAQIRQWRESDQIASEENLSLTSLENFAASARFGRRVLVVTGTTTSGGGRSSSRQSQWQEIGTIVQATITSQDDRFIVKLNYESTRYEPNEDEDKPGERLVIQITTHLILKPGERQVITNSLAEDRTLLLVEVSEIGQSRTTRRVPTSRPSGGRRPDPRRPATNRTPPSRSGTSIDERLSRFSQAMMQRYDANKDGIIDQNEANAASGSGFLGGRFRDLDLDKDGKVNADELTKYFEKRSRR